MNKDEVNRKQSHNNKMSSSLFSTSNMSAKSKSTMWPQEINTSVTEIKNCMEK